MQMDSTYSLASPLSLLLETARTIAITLRRDLCGLRLLLCREMCFDACFVGIREKDGLVVVSTAAAASLRGSSARRRRFCRPDPRSL